MLLLSTRVSLLIHIPRRWDRHTFAITIQYFPILENYRRPGFYKIFAHRPSF